MLILLPFLAFAALFLALLGRGVDRADGSPWQGAFLLASALWGAALVVMTEGLSLFTAIGRPGVVLSWMFVLLLAFVWGHRGDHFRPGWRRLREMVLGLNRFELALLAAIGLMALVLLAVVFAAPVNTVDVLQYHMPRVLQWAQNGSLEHFPTANASQNNRPYWAESVMLHLRLLWGDDTPVELVNWFLWLALAVPASGSALLLGADRLRAWLAGVFAWTIPTGVLHATTGMVDVPAAYWAGALGYFVLLALKRREGSWATPGLALSLGLGMLTKGTVFPFGAALMGLWGIALLARREWRSLVFGGLGVGLVMVTLNGLFWARNINTYGGPYGRSISVSLPLPSPDSEGEGQESKQEPSEGAAGLLGTRSEKLLRMGLLHFVTPVGAVNQALFSLMGSKPGLFPDPYLEPMKAAAWNNVMTGGSPVHWLLAFPAIGVTLIGPLFSNRTKFLAAAGAFALALLVGYLLLSLVDFAGSIFGVRYQLPFLVLAAPLVGLVLPYRWRPLVSLAAVGFVLYAAPYALLNHTRPAIGWTPWPTKIESVFATSDHEILFALSPEIQDEYSLVSNSIQASACRDVGLFVGPKDLEYVLWWLLESDSTEATLQHLPVSRVWGGNLDVLGEVCAVICTQCDRNLSWGLRTEVEAGHIQLLVQSE